VPSLQAVFGWFSAEATFTSRQVVSLGGSPIEEVSAVPQFDDFQDYVKGRAASMQRTAWFLTGGDWHRAQDLVQATLIDMWTHWSAIERNNPPDAYVRRSMVHKYLTWSRRRWRNELPSDTLPDVAMVGADEFDPIAVRSVVQNALKSLPARQRAVVVLRYYNDLSLSEVADVLGCSPGTVKSQSSKALAKLRNHPELDVLMNERQPR
jgi:RNA polymerase sigma-70 factor (sigma-E family)